MNKNLVTSISLLVAGVVVGVIVCIVCLTTVEWQKASKANQMHSANRQLAAKVSTRSEVKDADTKNMKLERNSTPIDPAARAVIPNILHQAVQTATMQGQWVGSDNGMAGMVPANGMVPGVGMVPVSGAVQVMPTTYIIPQPDIEVIVPGAAGPNRAINSADAIPMPIGQNGLQQNPCVDPSSSYGRAYNRGSSY